MELFHEIPDSQVILRSKGVYKQTRAFQRGDDVFATQGSGFIRLVSGGRTTVPTVHWLGIEGAGIISENGRAPKWVSL